MTHYSLNIFYATATGWFSLYYTTHEYMSYNNHVYQVEYCLKHKIEFENVSSQTHSADCVLHYTCHTVTVVRHIIYSIQLITYSISCILYNIRRTHNLRCVACNIQYKTQCAINSMWFNINGISFIVYDAEYRIHGLWNRSYNKF